jgi:putative transposase
VRNYEPSEGWTVAAYRFALDPTPDQDAALRSHCGAARKAFNWALGQVKAVMDQRRAEATYGLADHELTPALSWTLPALRKMWNGAKSEVAPWWAENSKECYNTGLANLAAALKNWSDSRNGNRAGRRMGFPRFRRKRAGIGSVRFTTGSFGLVHADRRHVKLPRIGAVRTHESTRKLARRLGNGTARILSATVSYRAGRWWCAFQIEVKRTDPAPAGPAEKVGVDLGISHLAVLSQPVAGVTDEQGMVANPRRLDEAQRRLRRISRRCSRRRGPDKRTQGDSAEPSKRWRKANATRSRLHARVTNLRRDGIHKLTTALAARFGAVVVEDLNVSGMLRNRRLARRIADAGFGEIRRQLHYKTMWRGGTLHVADRWFPSSKTCSGCGAVKAKLPLHVRVFDCEHCGLSLDRDINAARNLARLIELDGAAGTSTASCVGTVNRPAGNPRKTSRAGTGTATGRPPTARYGPTPAEQSAGSGHASTCFLDGGL